MAHKFKDLDLYSDWADRLLGETRLLKDKGPSTALRKKAREMLGVERSGEEPADVRREYEWQSDSLIGEQISWSVGYGPRTSAWVFRPVGADKPLPGILALHDHGGFKYYGKEKIAQGQEPPPVFMQRWWDQLYGGRPFVNALAREGYIVLVHDTFSWGSRRFPVETMPAWAPAAFAGLTDNWWLENEIPYEIGQYNFSAAEHEHILEKYCAILGTTLAAVVSFEDRVALNLLRSLSYVNGDNLGCIGLSGGGARSVLLQATSDYLKACVVIGMMSTYEHLLDRHVASHTWMLFPSGWPKVADWPDLASCRAPSPLLVQYDIDDDLFSLEGMQEADRKLARQYEKVGHPEAYLGEFYPGPHKFDIPMQVSAFSWISRWLKE